MTLYCVTQVTESPKAFLRALYLNYSKNTLVDKCEWKSFLVIFIIILCYNEIERLEFFLVILWHPSFFFFKSKGFIVNSYGLICVSVYWNLKFSFIKKLK